MLNSGIICLHCYPAVQYSHTITIISLPFRSNFTKTSGNYKKLGQFDYGQPSCTTDHIKTCFGKRYGDDWIYIGEVKEGADHTPHGIGIKVYCNGDIEEGNWKNDLLDGRGRTIYGFNLFVERGYCYIGEYKEGSRYGEGTYYFVGDKYTGQWDSNGRGKGEINYKDGTKYKGDWDWKDGGYKKHGQGTLYLVNGVVHIQGKWEWNEYKGKK